MEKGSLMNLIELLLLISVPGFCGGIIIAIHENYDGGEKLQQDICRKCSWLYYGGRGLIGTAGAFGAIFVAMGIGKIDPVGDVMNMLFILSLSFLAGTISFKLLPAIGNKLQKQLAEVEGKLEENKLDILKAKKEMGLAIEYTAAMGHAETALNRSNYNDIPQAIERLENIKKDFIIDRTLHIYLGRLYKKINDFDKAITVLRELIKGLESPIALAMPLSRREIDKADALFNIACYHSVKAADYRRSHKSEDEIKRLANEALEALKESCDCWQKNKDYAKADPDFDFLRLEYGGGFSEITS